MRTWAAVLGVLLIGCSEEEAFPAEDVPSVEDVGSVVDVPADVPTIDAGRADAGRADVGTPDVGRADIGTPDVGRADIGTPDVGRVDVGTPDAGRVDAGPSSPVFFATGDITTTASVGGTGGTLFNDDCPAGAAMVGFEGVVGADNYITQIAIVCATLRVEGDRVVTGATTTSPRRGINPGTDVSLRCPADQLIVGFEGRAGGLIDQVRFACAPYTAPVADGGRVVVRGTVTLTEPVGGTGGAPFARISCSDGAAQGAAVRAGDGVDSIALRCAALNAR